MKRRLDQPGHENEERVDERFEHDRVGQRRVIKAPQSGIVFATSTLFPTTSAAVVAIKEPEY